MSPHPRTARALPRRRLTLLALLAGSAFAVPALTLGWIVLSPAPARVAAAPLRGAVLSANGRVLAGGPLDARVYPQGRLAAPVVGFVGASGGLEGIERAQDAALSRGERVTLTIDTRVQAAAEAVLQEAVSRTEAAYASAAVMDARSGALLALASVPGFDANAWRAADAERWRNRAALDEYEPGSVVKALTVAALIDAGRTTPDARQDAPMRRRLVDRVAGVSATIRDAVPHPTTLSTRQVLRYSSNVGMTHLVDGVPAAELWAAYRRFGLGRAPALGLPAADGALRAPGAWTPLTQATMAFGQGMGVTTVQLAAAFNVLAGDGQYVAPRLLAAAKPATRPALRPETARTMRAVLHGVIDDGIGARAELPGYHAAGKTGTAQVAIGGRYSDTVYTSTFAGLVPADRPRFTVAVMVRGARRNYQGSQLAAPAFRDISASLLSLYGMAPQQHQPGEPKAAAP